MYYFSYKEDTPKGGFVRVSDVEYGHTENVLYKH